MLSANSVEKMIMRLKIAFKSKLTHQLKNFSKDIKLKHKENHLNDKIK